MDVEGNVVENSRNLTSCVNIINRFNPNLQSLITSKKGWNETSCVDFKDNDYILSGYAERESSFLSLIFTYCIDSGSE